MKFQIINIIRIGIGHRSIPSHSYQFGQLYSKCNPQMGMAQNSANSKNPKKMDASEKCHNLIGLVQRLSCLAIAMAPIHRGLLLHRLLAALLVRTFRPGCGSSLWDAGRFSMGRTPKSWEYNGNTGNISWNVWYPAILGIYHGKFPNAKKVDLHVTCLASNKIQKFAGQLPRVPRRAKSPWSKSPLRLVGHNPHVSCSVGHGSMQHRLNRTWPPYARTASYTAVGWKNGGYGCDLDIWGFRNGILDNQSTKSGGLPSQSIEKWESKWSAWRVGKSGHSDAPNGWQIPLDRPSLLSPSATALHQSNLPSTQW